MSEILTLADLEEITGARRTDKQRQVLDQHRIFYIVRLDGSIRTTWYHVNHPMRETAAVSPIRPRYDLG